MKLIIIKVNINLYLGNVTEQMKSLINYHGRVRKFNENYSNMFIKKYSLPKTNVIFQLLLHCDINYYLYCYLIFNVCLLGRFDWNMTVGYFSNIFFNSSNKKSLYNYSLALQFFENFSLKK